jgi:UPF0271 protein
LATKYIADATAFYASIPFKDVIIFTTPKIIEEVKHIKKHFSIINTLIDANIINVIEPSIASIKKAKRLAERSGDMERLSDADLSIIALALELEYEVLTDDYAIINVLKRSNMKVKSISTKMRKVGRWIKYCKGCKITFSKGDVCNRCGNKLSKKLLS